MVEVIGAKAHNLIGGPIHLAFVLEQATILKRKGVQVILELGAIGVSIDQFNTRVAITATHPIMLSPED